LQEETAALAQLGMQELGILPAFLSAPLHAATEESVLFPIPAGAILPDILEHIVKYPFVNLLV
jgi:hypothetical protein